ncbi:actin remodeling regulator NHS isoform X2 [Trichomycterus rosablanca]|uniref:actin remodeling regulator NHS isoform X2 n=1 Tax=Trichomycterus rosablanca TaxID=2290929 RepID=UPI002F35D9F4
MPFPVRSVEPQRLCRLGADPLGEDPGSDGPPVFTDLCSVSNAALSRAVRQLSDLARHASSLFEELERELASTDLRVRDLRDKIQRMERSTGEMDHKLETVPASSLDVESKLKEHYQSAWRPQRNVFLPSSRPACIEELHRNARQNLRALLRDQQQRQEVSERQWRATLSVAPATPTHPVHHTLHTDSDSDDVSLGQKSKSPIPNVPSPLDTQTNWSVALPLPTPDDRLRSQSEAIASCVVPIDVTGAGFDRDASVRCSLVHSQSVLQRRRKLKRRKTVAGIPRRVQQDSDESPVASDRIVIVHASVDFCQEGALSHLNTKDSCCQTDDFLIAAVAPSRRRIRAQRGQSVTVPLSRSTGNIPSLPDSSDTMFTTSVSSHLRSRSLPREASRPAEEVQDDSENDNDEEEDGLSQFEVLEENNLKDEEECTDEQLRPERQLGSLTFNQRPDSPEHGWMDRGRSHLPFKADEISSSSETFGSPIHSNTGGLACQMDHKDDHQSSSGNWSGSSSTCPSHTSETIPPPASPPLTGSSHCDSELYLNTALNATEDSAGSVSDSYCVDRLQDLDGHQAGSFSSSATDMLDDTGLGNASYDHHAHKTSCQQVFSPGHSRERIGALECPSFASIATFDSLDKPPSDKADTTSHYSVDAEGYFTSMHFDCGLKGSKSFTYNYASVDQQKEDHGGLGTVGRHSLSLRKPKVKPSPPKRCSSLKKVSSYSGPASEISQPKIPSDQNSLMSSKDSISQLESNDPSDQAEGGQASEDIPDVALLGFTKDTVQSDSEDFWLLNDLKSPDPYRSLSNSSTGTGTTITECIKLQESLEYQNSQPGLRASTPSLSSTETEIRLPSPEKLVGLASPSSGYSSQSETPTSSVPVAFFPNPKPGGKRKPKVPERKSSLASLQRRASKKDLELPIIPPSHLDLSAIHSKRKPSAHNHIVHNSKRKVDKPKPGASLITPDIEPNLSSLLEVTPMMLHTVQLRPVSKPRENHHQPCTDMATRPKCPIAPFVSKLNEPRKPPPYLPLSSEPPSQDSCESLFIPIEGPAFGSPPNFSFSQNRFDRLAPVPLFNIAASQELSEQEFNKNSGSLKVLAEEETSTSDEPISQQSSVATQKDQEVRSEPAEEEDTTESPPGQHGTAQESLNLDRVPDSIRCSSPESSQTNAVSDDSSQEEESGTSTRSASQETMEEGSTADTEYDFGRESTPSDPAVSPLTDESKADDDSVFISPTKTRTTEDLFAMIHRSKRKVLGRKDSGDLTVRSSPGAISPATSPSTPVIPLTPTSSQRASGPIYRSLKKSNTSNEEFKQLLLKKGSRSETSYRMSATEILKSPVTSRSFGDSLVEGIKNPEGSLSPPQLQSPDRTPELLHSPFPKTSVEGFSSRLLGSSRQGRSRIPPASISSRYSTRSRLYASPMQAISEGETENSDGSPHDDRSS